MVESIRSRYGGGEALEGSWPASAAEDSSVVFLEVRQRQLLALCGTPAFGRGAKFCFCAAWTSRRGSGAHWGRNSASTFEAYLSRVRSRPKEKSGKTH